MKKYSDLRRKSGFQPAHFEVLRLWAANLSIKEIAEETALEEAEVTRVVKGPAGKRLLQAMYDGTLETVRHMQVSIQALAPRALERLSKQLDSANEMVAHRAAVWVLEAAGHTPLRRLEIQHHLDSDEREALTLEELRQHAIERITGQKQPKMIETTATRADDETIH